MRKKSPRRARPAGANRFEVVVESCEWEDSIAWLRMGRARVASRLWPGAAAGQETVISIRPEDVVLCTAHPGRTSARNVLPGHVAAVTSVPEGAVVTVEVGFRLSALVTRRAVRELALTRGRGVFALVKAAAVSPDWELSARVRACLVGKAGLLYPEQMDFLKAVDRAGSLSGAARELGITFRTAWSRARSMNLAWGSPLVARVEGGHGGGGSALTADGKAALRLASAVERSPIARGR